MKLQDHVCTLEQAKRLKGLGVKQESYFYWQLYPETVYRRETMAVIPPISKEGVTDPGEFWSAYTVAELGIMLPIAYHTKRWFCDELSWGWYGYNNNGRCFPKDDDDFGHPTEAQTRAVMIIRLLENNRIKADEINARL